MGEKATQDVVAPVPLIAIDLEGTERLREQEAQRIPAVLRFDPAASLLAESELRAAFATRQSTTNRPEAELLSKLREAMSRYIRPEPLPVEASAGPARWWLAPRDAAIDLSDLSQFTNTVDRTNVFTKAQVRNEFIASFAPAELPTARFVAGFIRENCFIDVELTRALRASKTNALWAAEHYEPGQTIIKQGDLIDSRKKAALEKLAEKAAWDHAQSELVRAQGKAQAAIASLNETKASAQRRLWTVSLLAVGGVVGVIIILVVGGNRAPRPSIPNTEPTVALIAPATGQGSMLPVLHSWQQRALLAERQVQKLSRSLQIRLAPHLARWLAHKFIQQLLSNRRQILAIQQQASAEIGALDKRLVDMHASVQERLHLYENRVLELEAQLRATEQQNRELIEVTIAAAREKIEMERVAAGMEWS